MTNAGHQIKFRRDLTVDHINGLGRNADKSDNRMKNLQTLCLPCHSRKENAVRAKNTRVSVQLPVEAWKCVAIVAKFNGWTIPRTIRHLAMIGLSLIRFEKMKS